jgi:hypothetical protein
LSVQILDLRPAYLDSEEGASKLLFKSEFNRAVKKKITKITNLQDEYFTKTAAILEGFRYFYDKLFTPEGIDHTIADENVCMFCRHWTRVVL